MLFRSGTVFFLVIAAAVLAAVGTYYYVSGIVNDIGNSQQMYLNLSNVERIVVDNYIDSIDTSTDYVNIQDGIISLSLIHIYLTLEDMHALKADENDTDGLVSIPRRIDSVMLSAFIRQTSDGQVRASLRSECDLNVAEIAAKFGGGGHARAAGCSLGTDISSAVDTMIDTLRLEWRKYVDSHSG